MHSDGRAQGQPNRGQLGSQPRGQYNGSQQGPKHRDQTGAASRGQQTGTNPSFPPRGQQHAHFNGDINRRYSPPTFPSPGFNNTVASDAVGRSIIQLVENQSHSLDFILAGQQLQMDAYKEMTCSNQAREDDALFAGIQVYDGEESYKKDSYHYLSEQSNTIAIVVHPVTLTATPKHYLSLVENPCLYILLLMCISYINLHWYELLAKFPKRLNFCQ